MARSAPTGAGRAPVRRPERSEKAVEPFVSRIAAAVAAATDLSEDDVKALVAPSNNPARGDLSLACFPLAAKRGEKGKDAANALATRLADLSIAIMERNGVAVDVVRAVDHEIAPGTAHDMTLFGAARDSVADWPAHTNTLAPNVPTPSPMNILSVACRRDCPSMIRLPSARLNVCVWTRPSVRRRMELASTERR